MVSRTFRRTMLCVALGMGLASMATPPVQAGNNDGTVVGHTEAGAVVTISSAQTGFTRSVTADDKGNYRIPFLAIGDYTLSVEKDGKTITQSTAVTVTRLEPWASAMPQTPEPAARSSTRTGAPSSPSARCFESTVADG